MKLKLKLQTLKIKLKDEKVTKYFWDLVKGTMDYREKHNIIRHDMIHLLMEAKKGTKLIKNHYL